MKMTPENIRDATVRATRDGRRIEASDDDHRGLELGISPSGVRTWSLRVRDTTGRLRRFPVGSLADLGPSAARKAARALRARVEAGHDPIAEQRAKRSAGADVRAGIGTLRAIIDQYQLEGAPPKTWFTGAGRKRVERVFRDLMSKPVGTMRASDIMRQADLYPGSRQAAQNAIRAFRPFLTWAARRDYAPAGLLTVAPEEGVPTRDRVLTDEELKRVLPVLRAGKPPHTLVMLFILLTLARREEAAGATWGEIDLDAGMWTIPPERQKNVKRRKLASSRKPLVIPLSHQAITLLQYLKPKAAEPPPGMLIFAGERGRRLGNWDRAQRAIFHASGTSGWHRHDLRRTGSTMMGEAGVPPHVVEAALNHATIHSQLAGRYNQSRYRDDVKDALQTLANRYMTITLQFRQQPDERGEPEWIVVPQKLGVPA